jgi:hypothetical protein
LGNLTKILFFGLKSKIPSITNYGTGFEPFWETNYIYKMKKILLPLFIGGFFLLCTGWITSVRAQESKNVTQIYFEYGGASPAYSINVDTRFSETNKGFGARLGVGYQWDGPQRAWSVPMQINYLLGKRKHFFEPAIGLTYYKNNLEGSTWGMNSNKGSSVFGTLSLGYRFQPQIEGISVRGGVAGAYGSFLPIVVPYLSVGYAF